MTTHLGLQRILLPTAQVSSLTTGSITLPSARGQFVVPVTDVFQSIETITPTQGTSSISFASIPQTYQHLMIRGMMKSNDGGVGNGFAGMRYNNDSASNYWAANGYGNGTSKLSLSYNLSYAMFGQTPYLGNNNLYAFYNAILPNYTDSSNPQICFGDQILEQGGSDQATGLATSVWTTSSAITTITILGTFGPSCRFSLYGIKGAA